MIILIVLPILFFFLLFQVVFFKFQLGKRESFVISLLGCNFFILASTEILGLFNAITFAGAFTIWIVVLLAVTGYGFFNKIPLLNITSLKIKLSRFESILLGFQGLLLLTLLLLAIFSAPNNWDSMTYHMGRVAHWVQNQNVNHFPTHIIRQLFNPPFAEFSILHWQVLTRSDFFAQTVQWYHLLGCMIVGSLLCKQFGLNLKGQLLGSLLILTLPIGLYESMSTQNDIVLAFGVLSAYYFYYQLQAKFSWLYICLLALSFALSIATKTTSFLFLLPLVIAYILQLTKQIHKRQWLIGGCLITAFILIINTGYFLRNFQLYGEPIGLIEGQSHQTSNQVLNVKTTFSNLIKNTTYNLRNESIVWNDILFKLTDGLHRLVDLELNNPQTSSNEFFTQNKVLLYSEDYAPNFLHLILFLFTLPLLYIFKEKFSVAFFEYVVLIIASFIVFSTVLSWQHFITRLMLPMFIMDSVVIAVVLAKLNFLRKPWLTGILASLFILNGFYHVYHNGNKPLKGEKTIFNTSRENLYFLHRPQLQAAYKKTVEEIKQKGYKNIGLIIGMDDWEYPLFTYLAKENVEVYIEHVQVKNRSSKRMATNFKPDVILKIDNQKNTIELLPLSAINIR